MLLQPEGNLSCNIDDMLLFATERTAVRPQPEGNLSCNIDGMLMLRQNEPRRREGLWAPCHATLMACRWCDRANRGAGGACGVTVMSC